MRNASFRNRSGLAVASSLLLVSLVSCGGSSDAPDASAPDGGIQVDSGSQLDSTGGSDLSLPSPPPIKEWMVATISPDSSGNYPNLSKVLDALQKGTFELPAKGKKYDLDWAPVTPDADGVLSSSSGSTKLVIAAARFGLSAGQRVYGRFDCIYDLFTNGVPLPGDLYGSKVMRLPVASNPGSNLLAVWGIPFRGVKPQVELWTTSDELVLNPLDAVVPDLVVGDTTTSELWLGVPVLNLTDKPILGLSARVEASDTFAATQVVQAALPPGATTNVPFRLQLKAAPSTANQKISVSLKLEAASLSRAYTGTVELTTVAAGATFRRTFRSIMDGSAQYYAVVPPSSFDSQKSYALVLSLHGASVEGLNMAKAYTAKDWAYIIAPTNRRPFGFNWEEYGRVDAMEVLDHAMASYSIDPQLVYLTGHSMGGHGTYHSGVLFPGRFAAIGASGAWVSFASYEGSTPATGALGRARAASNTLDYVSNLAKRGVYILHGGADQEVTKAQATLMLNALQSVTTDVVYHEEPGAAHWWGTFPGANCVDWPALFDFFKAHKLDPSELTFKFKTPSPWVSAKHSFVTIVSELDAYQDCQVESKVEGTGNDTITLTTSNVRGLVLDGALLTAKGIAHLTVDGNNVPLSNGSITVGPQTGKKPTQHGPLNQVFQRPFCFVYDAQSNAYSRFAAYLTTNWAIVGRGLSCALPLSQVTAEIRANYNLIYLGVPRAQVQAAPTGVSWDANAITVGATSYPSSAVAVVFPEGERLGAAIFATAGAEDLLLSYTPFESRRGMPDYRVWSSTGTVVSGFFSPEWTYQSGK